LNGILGVIPVGVTVALASACGRFPSAWHVQAVVSMITSASGAELDASFARDDAGAERIFRALSRTRSKPVGGALPPKAVERRDNVVLGRTYAPIPPSMLRLEERCLR